MVSLFAEPVKIGRSYLVESVRGDEWFLFTPGGREVTIRVARSDLNTEYIWASLEIDKRTKIRLTKLLIPKKELAPIKSTKIELKH